MKLRWLTAEVFSLGEDRSNLKCGRGRASGTGGRGGGVILSGRATGWPVSLRLAAPAMRRRNDFEPPKGVNALAVGFFKLAVV
jgi:hypothetical protein